jgi:hypothetical protein
MQGHIVPESLHTEPLNNANIGLWKAIKPVTLIKVFFWWDREDTTTIKNETNLLFFTFLLQLSTPI